MAKQKKKRNKVYAGKDSASLRPSVTRIKAVKRSKLRQWWIDNKKIVKPVLIAASVVFVIVWLIFELIRAIA